MSILLFQGTVYATERCYLRGTKYLAIGGYVSGSDVQLKQKFDLPVILENDDYTILDQLLNTHVKSKLGRDMKPTESAAIVERPQKTRIQIRWFHNFIYVHASRGGPSSK